MAMSNTQTWPTAHLPFLLLLLHVLLLLCPTVGSIGSSESTVKPAVSQIASSSPAPPSKRCLTHYPVVKPQRNLFFEGKSLPITIETSNRPSHQLVSNIFKILVDEVLGYNAIVKYADSYNDMEPTAMLNRLAGCTKPGCFTKDTSFTVPETMVNLEVWSSAGFNMEPWIAGGLVLDNGPLGPFGKFGWFMPTDTVQKSWKNNQQILDHWRSLQNQDIAQLFADFEGLGMDEAPYKEKKRGRRGQNRGQGRVGGGVRRGKRVVDTEDTADSNSQQATDAAVDYDEDIDVTKSTVLGDGEEWMDELGFLTEEEHDQYAGMFEEDTVNCGGERCPVIVFRPDWCKLPAQQHCALLLSSYQALDAGSLVQQVKDLELPIQIAWVGKDLNTLIQQQRQKRKPTLFFNWVPNLPTISNNYTRVNFPFCLNQGKHESVNNKGCDFEVQQLSKLSWVRLERHAPFIHHLLQRLMFTQHAYEDVLSLYASMSSQRGAESYHQAACTWLREHEYTWKQWIPKNMPNETVLYLAGMFPITGKLVRQPGVVMGAELAIVLININKDILKNYKMDMIVHDTMCQPDIVLAYFLSFLVNVTHPIVGLLGPSCPEVAEPVAGVAKHFNRIIVSYSAEAVHLSKRSKFPYFFRTMPHITRNGHVFLKLFEALDWKQVALLAEDGQEFPEYHTYLQDLFLAHGISVVFHRRMPRDSGMEDAHKYLEEIRQKGAKIIILTSFEVSGRAVFCEAYKQKMTAEQGYVWFLPGWFTHEWWDTDNINPKKISAHIDCTSAQMLETIQSHLELTSAIFGPENSTIVGNITVKKWKEVYNLYMSKQRQPEPSSYASYAYDAVWVFALALDKLLKEDPSRIESIHTDETRNRFMYFLNNTYFQGVTGPVQFKDRDRTGIIDITLQLNNSTQLVGQYLTDQNNSDEFMLKPDMIRAAFGGRIPEDGRQKQCSVENFRALLGVDCMTALVIINVLAVVLFGVIILGLFIVVKKRYDDKVLRTHQRMEELGLMADTSWLSLDQWEIAREHVVLNRKLGEGAFGTVYGGEANIEDIWMAVAVKTLKVGSNPEEKLNFLSEAEMMKRFDHENIVKLLGVCTRGEPAYTIMEFMLHGDLKTFLLARRHLVGDNSREAEDISTRSLTRMAIDIATGLEYLSSQSFVHRDLACRNCLVHATKTVKLGDFGMTRSMYDSDYYRFSRQGMLPVRWMAPESLTDGLFTPKSDVWSFGVLLYEIMTFGSFPYQGLGNKQVLEHVKEGKIITLPDNCSDELQRMLRSCWRYDPQQRADINSLREQLCNKPCLIQPCLDAPRSAVDPPEDMEDRLHDVRYKRTLSEHSHLKNLELSGVAGPSSGGATGGRALQTSPTALSITSDPLSHEEVMSPSHDVLDWQNAGGGGGERLECVVTGQTPPLPPLPPLPQMSPPHNASSGSLKDMLVKIPASSNNHMRPYVIRAPKSSSEAPSTGGRPLSTGERPSIQNNQNHTSQRTRSENSGSGSESSKSPHTMRTITNPMSNPEIIQFIARRPSNDSEPNGYSAGAACLTNGAIYRGKAPGRRNSGNNRRGSGEDSVGGGKGVVALPMREHTRGGITEGDSEEHRRPHELILRKESVA